MPSQSPSGGRGGRVGGASGASWAQPSRRSGGMNRRSAARTPTSMAGMARAKTSEASRREQRRSQHQDLSRTQLLDAAEEVFGSARASTRPPSRRWPSWPSSPSGRCTRSSRTRRTLRQRLRAPRRGVHAGPAPGPGPRRRPALAQLHRLSTSRSASSASTATSGASSCDPRPARCPPAPRPGGEGSRRQLRRRPWTSRPSSSSGARRAGPSAPAIPQALARLFSGLIAAFQSQDPPSSPTGPAADERLTLVDLHDIIERAFRA